ncbi:MAG TPA: HEAT repeat domain-containing protein, partial [Kofleriaceae bacterium]|nr:HEAT repeat domain-containing protein [Kofleriaceae bacterium]
SLAAIAALGAMGDGAAAAPLLTIARSGDPKKARAAICALGDIGAGDALALFRERLFAADDATAAAAARAMGRIGGASALKALIRAAEVGGFATAINATAALAELAPALSGAGKAALASALGDRLGDERPLVRANAAAAAGRAKLGPLTGAITAILAADPSTAARKSAATALARIAASGDTAKAAHEAITTALTAAAHNDPSAEVRAAATAALAGPAKVVPRESWVTFRVIDPDAGAPVAGEAYFVIDADGLVTAFYTDSRGMFSDEAFPAGPYTRAPRP